MRRRLVGLAALVLVVVVIVELAALPVATRLAERQLERCLPVDDLEVESIDRPVLPRLLVGRARDVEVRATGLRCDEIRVERARMELPEVSLPWAIGPRTPTEATLELELAERDLQDYLAERTPLGLDPFVELTPGVAALGIEPLPARVRVEVEVRDRVLRIAPVGEAADWLTRLGLDLSFELPPDARLDRLDVRQDALLATLRVEVDASIDGSAGPLGDAGRSDREVRRG